MWLVVNSPGDSNMQWGMGTTDAPRAPSPVIDQHDKCWPLPLTSSVLLLLLLCSSALLAYLHSPIKWEKTSRWSRWLRHWQNHWKHQWVIRCWSWWYFLVTGSVRGFHFPRPEGLVMWSTSRLLVYKTIMQKLFTKINDARPAIKKLISQVTCSAEPHQLL